MLHQASMAAGGMKVEANMAGRKKLCEGKNIEAVLEEEMKELAEKLEELQSNYNGGDDRELRKCKNFDKKASRLQRRLEKLGGLPDDERNKEIKNDASFHYQSNVDANENTSILDRKSQPKSTDGRTTQLYRCFPWCFVAHQKSTNRSNLASSAGSCPAAGRSRSSHPMKKPRRRW
ncbi:hypothetical protein L1887_10579 [Cichorium endivia]|nr:hypothetical protein L1887_10579 [Cichorium endivia]